MTAVAGVPFKLNAQDMGAFDSSEAMSKGQKLIADLISAHLNDLAAQKAQAELPYAGDAAKAALQYTQAGTRFTDANTQKAQQEIQYNPENWAAQNRASNASANASNSTAALNQLKLKYPGLGEPGIIGELAYRNLLSDNPVLAKQYQAAMGGQNPSQPQMPPAPQQPQAQQSPPQNNPYNNMTPVPGVNQNAQVLAKYLGQQPTQSMPAQNNPISAVMQPPQQVQQQPPQNTFSAIQMLDRDMQTENDFKKSQTLKDTSEANKINYLLNHPGFMGGNEAKTIEALKLMGIIPNDISGNNQPSNSPQQQSVGTPTQQDNKVDPAAPFKTNNQLANAVLNRPFAETAYKNKMLQGYNWAHLPTQTKLQMEAAGYGMGIDPMKMQEYVNKGMTLRDMAVAEHLDPDNIPPPIYPPTTATLSRTQQVQQVAPEIDYLSSATTPLLKEYANTFGGKSFQRIADQWSSDPEAQKRYGRGRAALAVQTGIAAGRILMEGNKPSVQVLNQIKNTALAGIDQDAGLRNSKVAFQEAQDTINELLQKGAKIRTTTGMNPFSEIGKAHSKQSTSSSPGRVRNYDIKTGTIS